MQHLPVATQWPEHMGGGPTHFIEGIALSQMSSDLKKIAESNPDGAAKFLLYERLRAYKCTKCEWNGYPWLMPDATMMNPVENGEFSIPMDYEICPTCKTDKHLKSYKRDVNLDWRKAKPHTIRPNANPKPGEEIEFYSWMGKPYRSKWFRIDRVVCTGTQKIEIKYDPHIHDDPDPYEKDPFYTVLHESKSPNDIATVLIDNRRLRRSQVKNLAINDGFDSAEHFFQWFNTDFNGHIIHWTDLKY